MSERDRNDESVSGAMRRGQAAGTEGAPLPRTDAADPGVEPVGGSTPAGGTDATVDAFSAADPSVHMAGGPGDGMRTGGSAGTASGLDPMRGEYDVDDARRRDPHPDQVPGSDDAGAQGRDRENGGWGDRGIGGGRAGGTGL